MKRTGSRMGPRSTFRGQQRSRIGDGIDRLALGAIG